MLESYNKELQDLIIVAQFNPFEQAKFISTIKRFLKSKNITLDSLESR